MRRGMYADGSCLYLKVDKSGAKRWILRLVIHGKRQDLGVGGLSLVSLAEAREEAVRLRKIARAGGDPLAERRKQRRAAELERSIPTFDAAARQVYAEHSKTFRNELHKKHWIESLEKFVFPFIGDRRMDQIDTGDVLKALTPIWLKVPETARRVKQRTKVIFDWAKASGYRKGSTTRSRASKNSSRSTTPKTNTSRLTVCQHPCIHSITAVLTPTYLAVLASSF
jgi:hypothetical protein